MFQCLVMYISLNKIDYVHTRARYILATPLRLSHVCGVHWSRVWRKSKFLEHSIGGWQHANFVMPRRWNAVSRLLLHHHRDSRII
jgi:hypothetical protein